MIAPSALFLLPSAIILRLRRFVLELYSAAAVYGAIRSLAIAAATGTSEQQYDVIVAYVFSVTEYGRLTCVLVQTDGRTGRRPTDRYIDHAPHTMQD